MGLKDSFREWFEAKVPGEWFTSDLEISADRREILVLGTIAEPTYPKGADEEAKPEARKSEIARFREATRGQRIEIASEAERLFNRKVSWGVRCGDTERMFAGLGVPVMTRLRLKERSVLDTLVSSGVARSRSEALAWCVSLVASKQGDWLDELREATKKVREVREEGPRTVAL